MNRVEAQAAVEGIWRTVSGRRIFIKTDQNLIDAMSSSGKFDSFISYQRDKYSQPMTTITEKNVVEALKNKNYNVEGRNFIGMNIIYKVPGTYYALQGKILKIIDDNKIQLNNSIIIDVKNVLNN